MTEDQERRGLLDELRGLLGPADKVALGPPETTGDGLLAERCRGSFKEFVLTFWEEVPGAFGQPLVWNWHLDFLCDDLQKVAERVFRGLPRAYDEVVNVSPGTTKSTVCSILFNAWLWTRMPAARVLTASHTDSLVMDLANKTRAVVKSELYRRLFPGVQIRGDQDTKSYFANTHGGDRYTCTVAGKSPMGFHAHFILCLPWESRIMTDRGWLPIGRVVDDRLPVRVLAYDHGAGRAVWRHIEAYERNPARPLWRISASDGTTLEATEDHPVFVTGRGYVPAVQVRVGDEVLSVGPVREVWQEILPQAAGRGAEQVGLGVLLPPLSGGVHERAETPALFRHREGVCRVRVADEGAAGSRRHPTVLRVPVPGEGSARGGRPSVQAGGPAVRLVRENDTGTAVSAATGQLLLAGARQPGPRETYERRRQPELHPRPGLRPLPGGVSGGQSVGPPSRPPLPHMREGPSGERRGPECPPHRLGQDAQRQGESGRPVPVLSFGASGHGDEAAVVGTATVTAVERSVRLPAATYNVRVSDAHNYFAEGLLVHNCDDPIDPKKAVSDVELDSARDFMSNIIPTRKVDKAVAVTFLIMQRLHYRDPTAVMLDNARKPGGVKVRHVCLPAELYKVAGGGWDSSPVSPRHLAKRYADGLMDPLRLGRQVLDEMKASLGPYGYSGQFLQSPHPPGGGMFKEVYFTVRVPASPYECKRVRAWDRAATQDGGAYTAGVLQARHPDRTKHSIEHVVHGQWEPDERDRVMIATARRDRLKYGPKYEPLILIEQEPGSAGVEAYRNIARRLAALGFRVKSYRPTGSKDTRAEPWSCMCAALGVELVDDGTWDVEGYVKEHLLFRPETGKRLGKYKDQVDASSMGYSYLVGPSTVAGRNYRLGASRRNAPHFLALTSEDVGGLEVDPNVRVVLVWVEDGPTVEIPELPFRPVATATAAFWDQEPKDLQEVWEEDVAEGLRPADVVMSLDHGKAVWSAVLKRRDPPAQVFAFYSPGGGRALSLAMAVCDRLGRPRSTIYRPARPDSTCEGVAPPSQHAYDVTAAARASVVDDRAADYPPPAEPKAEPKPEFRRDEHGAWRPSNVPPEVVALMRAGGLPAAWDTRAGAEAAYRLATGSVVNV